MSEGARIVFSCELRVRYADTDTMGVVYYAKYLEYFEVARTEMLRACGLPYAELESMGFFLPVIEASVKYFRGAKYDDRLRIVVSMPATPGPKLDINYEVSNSDSSERIAEGRTILAFVDRRTGKPTRPPQRYIEALRMFHSTSITT